MNRFTMISNTQLMNLINDWIKNERDRQLLKRRLIDGISYERLAEEFELSVQQVYRITNKNTAILYSICNDWITISG